VPNYARTEVFERDHRRCRFCGTLDDLHLHHIHYRSESPDHRVDNLIVLCAAHHSTVHSDKRRWQPVLETYIAELAAGRQRFIPAIEAEPETGG
jgi:5-methylcytosine-specific restriction endonuclease McrA